MGGLDPSRAFQDPVRRAEALDRHSRYYAMHPADPAPLKRGRRPDFVDADGRRYRIADQGARGGLGRDLISLDVREARGERALDETRRARADLELLDPSGVPGPTVTIAQFGVREPGRRTWRIHVRGLDAATVDMILAARPPTSQ